MKLAVKKTSKQPKLDKPYLKCKMTFFEFLLTQKLWFEMKRDMNELTILRKAEILKSFGKVDRFSNKVLNRILLHQWIRCCWMMDGKNSFLKTLLSFKNSGNDDCEKKFN